MAERSYEIVCAIINICRDPQEAPAPAIIPNIIQFSEYVLSCFIWPFQINLTTSRTLEKILTFVRSQVTGSVWRRVIPSLADKALLRACNAGLKNALDVFGVRHLGSS